MHRWLLLLAVGCGDTTVAPPDAPVAIDAAIDAPRPLGVIDGLCMGAPAGPRVLVYSRENQWRHTSNLDARQAIYDMCESRGFTVTTTNDPLAINAARLAETDVVVFAITSGNGGIDAAGRADFERWVAAGGGLVGLHSASSTEHEWPFYVTSIGAKFKLHEPGLQLATVTIESGTHPITEGLLPFQHTDEWYVFEARPEEVPGMQMLLALDESTLPPEYPAGSKIGYHAIGWAHEKFGGRTFYTALGHAPESFEHPAIVEIVARSIEWAAHQR